MTDTIYMLTIAGFDTSGGAGLIRDVKVAQDFGVWGLSAQSCLTIQDFNGLAFIEPTSTEILDKQIRFLLERFEVSAIKVGAICNKEQIQSIIHILKDTQYPKENIVLDPVFSPTKGKAFLVPDDVTVYRELLRCAGLVTPNRKELEILTNQSISTLETAVEAANQLQQIYDCAFYIKGGHFSGSTVNEALITGNDTFYFSKRRMDFAQSHGTGCAFSSAIAALLARNEPLKSASELATAYVSKLFSGTDNS